MADAAWQINFYRRGNGSSPVEEWLDGLSNEARAEIAWTLNLLKQHGIMLKKPYVAPIGEKMFEVRAKDSNGIYRILYFAHIDKTFMMLHGFTKKTAKTPRKDIEIAKKRMREVRDGRS
ncbi:toxin RelE [Campylobacterota bacterium]|nr:toxin RelE [Campylobacterota bacterium]